MRSQFFYAGMTAGLLAVCTAVSGQAAQLPVVEACEAVILPDIMQSRHTGRVLAESSVQLIARVSGEILRQGFTDGALVHKDQVMYEIDPVRYQAAVDSAQGQVAQAQAAYDYAVQDLERKARLYRSKSLSADAYDNAVSTERSAKGTLLQAKAQLALAQDDLDNTVITSPIDGKAGISAVTPGNYVQTGAQALVSVNQFDPVRVRFAVSMRELTERFSDMPNLLHEGKVQVMLSDGTVYPHSGKVDIIDNAADSGTDTLYLYSTLQNPEWRLMPGSTVSVTLSNDIDASYPAVIPTCLQFDSEGYYVYVIDSDNTVHRRQVTPGSVLSDMHLITEGLKAGEIVVSQGVQKVSQGAAVTYQLVPVLSDPAAVPAAAPDSTSAQSR